MKTIEFASGTRTKEIISSLDNTNKKINEITEHTTTDFYNRQAE